MADDSSDVTTPTGWTTESGEQREALLAVPGAFPPAVDAALSARIGRDKVLGRIDCGHDNHVKRLACASCGPRKVDKV